MKKFVRTYSAAKETFWELKTQEKLGLSFFAKKLKQTSFWAYYIFLYSELNRLVTHISKNSIWKVKNEVSDKVALLVWGVFVSPEVLRWVKEALEEKWVSVKVINRRYVSSPWTRKVYKRINQFLDTMVGKRVVLFGYSAWGNIVHSVREKRREVWRWDFPVVTFWTPIQPDATLPWAILWIFRRVDVWEKKPSSGSVNLYEKISFMTPVPKIPEWWKRLPGVYSHMSIWEQYVIDAIVDEIMKKLE